MSRQVGEGKQKVLFSQPFPSTSAPSLSSLRPAVPSEKCGPRSPVRRTLPLERFDQRRHLRFCLLNPQRQPTSTPGVSESTPLR